MCLATQLKFLTKHNETNSDRSSEMSSNFSRCALSYTGTLFEILTDENVSISCKGKQEWKAEIQFGGNVPDAPSAILHTTSVFMFVYCRYNFVSQGNYERRCVWHCMKYRPTEVTPLLKSL
jgi:hypothetical protein